MSDDVQPGPHLSPDQLSAFAENVLPEHERLAALTHLSACADCRQVVFLTQQTDLSPTAAPAPETPRPGWFTFPQLFGAATAAFACALIVALVIHLHRDQQVSAPPITTAKVEATPALASPAPVPPPSSQIPEARPASNRFQPVEKGSAMENAPPPPAKAQMAPSPQIIAMGAAVSSGYITEAKQKDKSNNDYLSATNGTTFAALTPQKAPATVAGAMPIPAPQPAAPTQRETRTRQAYATAAVPMPPTSAEVASMTETFDASSVENLPLNGRATDTNALRKTTVPTIKLPSKKQVASLLNATGQTLALDTDGALFLSNDHGKHWIAVATQWSGKAVQLRFAATPARLYLAQPTQNQAQKQSQSQIIDGITAAAGVPQQQVTIPNAGFELTTANGAVWLSTDGLTWHAR